MLKLGLGNNAPSSTNPLAVDALANFLDPDFIIKPSAETGTEVEGSHYDYPDDDDDDGDDYDY